MVETLMTTRRRPQARSLFSDLFDDFFAPLTAPAARHNPMAMNVAETTDAFRLSFELPGVQEKDIQVQLEENQLVVSAERRFDDEKQEGADFHRVEHHYGSFARSLTLPRDVKTDGIEATFKNGVLTVIVPKAEPTKAKKIEIRAE
jgi:HSP20 family protein